jgi:hypothetical protein
MGKWSAMKGQLVRFTQPVEWQQKIDKQKQELQELSLKQLCEHMVATRAQKDQLNSALEDLNTELEALNQLMLEELETEGLTSIKTEQGTFYIQDEPYASVQSKTELIAWVKETGQEELLSLNYMTLSSLTKGRLEAGENPPRGVNVFLKSTIRTRKA